jgi:hypothetical protein
MSNLSPLAARARSVRQARLQRAARFRLAHQVNLLRWQYPELTAAYVRDQLVEEYGKVEPFGTLRRGGASERCWACGSRDYGDGCYLWLPGPIAVCNASCAAVVAERTREELTSAGGGRRR